MFQKSSPKPFFVLSSLVLTNLVLNLTDIRFLHVVISALWELATLHHCRSSFLLTFSFWIWKILHGFPIRSRWKAVQELSSGVCLKASSSSGGVPSCIQRGSSFHLSRKFWFWTACVTLSSLNHLAYFGLETLVCNVVYSYLCVWGLCGSSWNRSCHTAKDVSTLFCFLGE